MKPTIEPSVEPSTVSLTEASRLLAKPENTIREWIKSSKLPAHRDSRGRWLIARHDLMSFAVTRGSVEPRLGASSKAASKRHKQAEGSVDGSTEPSSSRYVRSLEATLEREQRINDELRARVVVLEQERTQHMAEMRALLSRDGAGKEGVLSRWIRR